MQRVRIPYELVVALHIRQHERSVAPQTVCHLLRLPLRRRNTRGSVPTHTRAHHRIVNGRQLAPRPVHHLHYIHQALADPTGPCKKSVIHKREIAEHLACDHARQVRDQTRDVALECSVCIGIRNVRQCLLHFLTETDSHGRLVCLVELRRAHLERGIRCTREHPERAVELALHRFPHHDGGIHDGQIHLHHQFYKGRGGYRCHRLCPRLTRQLHGCVGVALRHSRSALVLGYFRNDVYDHSSEQRPELNDNVLHPARIHLLDFGRPGYLVLLPAICAEFHHEDDVVCKERPERCQQHSVFIGKCSNHRTNLAKRTVHIDCAPNTPPDSACRSRKALVLNVRLPWPAALTPDTRSHRAIHYELHPLACRKGG